MSAMPPLFALRVPPHDERAERALLGGVLRCPGVLEGVAAVVRPDAFYFDPHQKLFEVFLALQAGREPVDLVSVADALTRRNWLADLGGYPKLAELWADEPTGANAEYHAAIVRDLALLRALIHTAAEIGRDAHDRVAPPAELIAAAEQKLFALGQMATSRRDPVPAREFIPEALRQIDARIADGGRGAGLSSGFEGLDNVLGGFRPGQLTIIAARPSVGKTALAMNVAVNVAAGGVPVLMFSLEMSVAELAHRLLAMASGVPLHRIARATYLDEDEAARLNAAAGPDALGGCPIYVDDAASPTAPELIGVARRAVRRHGVGLVVVDYIGLLSPEDSRAPRVEQVSLMSRRMKELARACGVPVLCLSQLNREVEHRQDGPRLSDLRDSGSLEQDADNVIFLHRQNQDEGSPVWAIEVRVAKQRNGPIGGLTLDYRRALTRFESPMVGRG